MRTIALSLMRLSVLAAACALVSGCGTKEREAGLSIQFPDWKAMHAADVARQSKVSTFTGDRAPKLSMVIVNVTGPGIPSPIFFQWPKTDAERGGAGPTSVDLVVPTGPDRLVQALAVYEGPSGMQFFYDDENVKISANTDPVPLVLSNVATTQEMQEGDIIGRFMETANGGPTGVLEYRFGPPGKPSMIIHHGEIYGGWASLFSFSKPFLSYAIRTKDGRSRPIFEGLSNTSSGLFNPANRERSISVMVPAGFRQRYRGANDISYEGEVKKRVVVGFFGPGAGAQRVCYSPSNGTDEVDQFYAAANETTPITWNGSGAVGTASQAYLEVVGGATGGNASANCANPATEDWTNFVKFDHTALANKEPLAFTGPFKSVEVSPYGEKIYAKLAHNGLNTMTATWSYLPGVQSATFSSVGVFWRVVQGDAWNDDELRGNDGYLCNEFSKPSFGFTEVKVNLPANSAEFNVPSSDAERVQVMVCPYNSDAQRYFESAVRGVKQHDSHELKVEALAKNISVSGGCAPIKITHYVNGSLRQAGGEGLELNVMMMSGMGGSQMGPGNGTVGVFTTPTPMPSPPPNGGGQFYTTSTCSAGSELGALELAASESEKTVYFSASSNPGIYEIVVSGGNNGNVYLNQARVTVAAGLPMEPATSEFRAPEVVTVGSCHFVALSLLNADGKIANSSAKNFTLGAMAGVTAHSDASCSSAAVSSQLQFAANEFVKGLYFKFTSSGGKQLTATRPVGVTGLVPTSIVITVDEVAATKLNIEAMTNLSMPGIFEGSCFRINVVSQTVNGVPTKVNARTPIALTAPTGVQFSQSPTCTGSVSTGSTFIDPMSPDGRSQEVWINVPAGMGQFNVTASDASASPTLVANTQSFLRKPTSVMAVASSLPDQGRVMAGYCHRVVARLVNGVSPVDASGRNLVFDASVFAADNSYIYSSVYSDSSCTMPVTGAQPLAFSSATGEREFSFKVSSASANQALNLTLSSQVLGVPPTQAPLTFASTSGLKVVSVPSGSGSVSADTCVSLEFRLLDSSNNPFSVSDAVDLNVIVDGGGSNLVSLNVSPFYTNSGCTGTHALDVNGVLNLGMARGANAKSGVWVKLKSSSLSSPGPKFQVAVPAIPGVSPYTSGFDVCTTDSCSLPGI